MTWAVCSVALEKLGLKSRFQWPEGGWADFNCEAGTTVSDVTGGIAWIWTYPGDWLLRSEKINQFFELEPLHTGGYASSAVGLVVSWLCAIIVGGLLEAAFRP